ncbi:MAG TPA: hypothetical protein VFR97_05570, partial [Capillimicrobium sp.]|nr:hypothetical protein [Capillimicrobium sp.]
ASQPPRPAPASTQPPAPMPDPDAPPSAAPPSGATPPGPPPIPFHRGHGRLVGATARSAYTAQAFAPIPRTFRRGGIPAGSRAGACRVRAPGRADRRQLARLARSLHPGETLQGIFDENVLLADCGRLGEHGILVWTRIAADRDRTLSVIEIVRRRGGWQQRRNGRGVGCTVPRAAASAWRIDVSPCRGDRA